jgi:RND family efflux transporter MFP subunit
MNKMIFGMMTLLGLAGFAGCGGTSRTTPDAVAGVVRTVKTAAVEILSASGSEEIAGTISPRNRAEVATKIQARVEKIPVKLGSHVDKGDILAELDMNDIRARQTQAQAVYDQASQDLKRSDQLLERKLVSQQEYDHIKTQAEVARANLGEIDALLSYARVVAPFAGIVTQKMIDLGDLTVPGRPLFTIEEDASLRLIVSIPESKRNQIKVGDTMAVSVPSIGLVLTGTIAEISNGADPSNRSFETKIELPTRKDLRSGQYGRLILASDSASGLFIPASAVVHRGQLELAYVANNENHASLRLIRIGRRIGDRVEVLSGLAPAERVIIEIQDMLADGDQIKEMP